MIRQFNFRLLCPRIPYTGISSSRSFSITFGPIINLTINHAYKCSMIQCRTRHGKQNKKKCTKWILFFIFCCPIKTPSHWDNVTIEIIGDLNQMNFSTKEYSFDLNKKMTLFMVFYEKFRVSAISLVPYFIWITLSEVQFVGLKRKRVYFVFFFIYTVFMEHFLTWIQRKKIIIIIILKK